MSISSKNAGAGSSGRTGAKVLRPDSAGDVTQATGHRACQQVADSSLEQQRLSLLPTASDVEAPGPQQLGVLRRKPGRGDPTLSLSCSDKLARWACLGLQGCLLSCLLAAPLRLELLAVSLPPLMTPGMENQEGGTTAAATTTAATTSTAATTTTRTEAARGASADCQQQQVDLRHQQLLHAVEAAGWRALCGRLQECAARLAPPYGLRAPHVVAVPPPPVQLGLSPDTTRRSPSGVC